MVRTLLRSVIRTAVVVALGYWLTHRSGLALAIAVVAVAALLSGCVGAWLLRGAGLGEISWRNHLAGWLLPFGFLLGGGQLPRIVATSTAICAALACAGGACEGHWPLLAAWLVDGRAALYVLHTARNVPAWSPGWRTMMLAFAALLALVIAGFVAMRQGEPWLGAAIAGGPMLALGLLYGGWVVLVVTIGRRARWN